MRVGRFAFGALACVLVLSGCAVLGGGSKPLDTFELTAAPVASAPHGKTRRQVLVAEPTALKALDSESIVVKPSAKSIQYLGGAQWADRLPRIVQARLAETLQRSGRFGGVGRPGDGLAIDYQILTDIRSFEVRLDGGKRAEVQLFVQVLNDRNGVVRASRLFTAAAPVSGEGADAFVAGLDSAFHKSALDILDWLSPLM